jgi:hypothetical protein
MECQTFIYKPRYVNTLYTPYTSNMSRDSSVNTVTRPRAKHPMIRGWIPGMSRASRVSLEHTQPVLQRRHKRLSLRVKKQGREADHSLPFAPRLRMSGATPPTPHKSSVHAHWQLHVYTTSNQQTYTVKYLHARASTIFILPVGTEYRRKWRPL